MSRFIDGPAGGVELSLRRAPIMLRVVHMAPRSAPWDALDQPGDSPAQGELVYVYRMLPADRSSVMRYHLSCRGKGKSASGWYESASYEFLPDQPGDQHTRDNKAWAAWCDANKDHLLGKSPA